MSFTSNQKQILYSVCIVILDVIDVIRQRPARFGLPLTAADDDRWITLGGGEKDTGEHKGRHVKIDEQGNIVGGSIPKSAQ